LHPPVLITLASVTGSLVDIATHVIRSLGYGGVAALNFTSGVIGIPGSELTMLFAGFNVYLGHLTLPGIIFFGVLGDMAGACTAYGIGYYGRRELFERHGGKVHMSGGRVDRAGGWYDRHGAAVIIISRLIPFARAAFPYAAGVLEIPFRTFVPLATIGSVIWITALGILGREVGSNWQTWRHYLEYVDYLGAALVVGAIAYVIVRRARRPRVAS
jgi:membrane protein DedA with SNARE-associated domain